MNYFGQKSSKNLNECHPDLIKIFKEVIKHVNCSILEGQRSQDEQDNLFYAGKSKLKFPDSKHNKTPSMAVDAVPYPIDWNDKKRFYYFGGMVLGISKILYNKGEISHKVRWGGDWDNDNTFKDQTFHDLPHFELMEA